MRANEKQMMIDLYTKQFNYFLLSDGSESEKTLLEGQRQMLKLFFTDNEIKMIENKIRVTSQYLYSHFESIQSWVKQIEGKEIVFEWTRKGLDMIKDNYDWVDRNEYKGFYIALELTYKYLDEKAA